ncbi:hypothetical protein U1Q18_026924 [Sarracenia purpurea var. burkii]
MQWSRQRSERGEHRRVGEDPNTSKRVPAQGKRGFAHRANEDEDVRIGHAEKPGKLILLLLLRRRQGRSPTAKVLLVSISNAREVEPLQSRVQGHV